MAGQTIHQFIIFSGSATICRLKGIVTRIVQTIAQPQNNALPERLGIVHATVRRDRAADNFFTLVDGIRALQLAIGLIEPVDGVEIPICARRDIRDRSQDRKNTIRFFSNPCPPSQVPTKALPGHVVANDSLAGVYQSVVESARGIRGKLILLVCKVTSNVEANGRPCARQPVICKYKPMLIVLVDRLVPLQLTIHAIRLSLESQRGGMWISIKMAELIIPQHMVCRAVPGIGIVQGGSIKMRDACTG